MQIFWKTTVLGMVMASASLTGGADAEADGDQCVRLDSHIDHCSDYPPNQCPNLTDLTFYKQRSYWTRNLTKPGGKDAVILACKKYYQSISQSGEIDARKVNGAPWETGGQCKIDGQPGVNISLWGGKREDECELTLKPANPYAKLVPHHGPYERGGQFTDRSAIIESNKKRNNPPIVLPGVTKKVKTDVPDVDLSEVLAHSTATPDPEDDLYGKTGLPIPDGPNRDDYANIDHIIPRVDIHGCECGTNSPINAAVISRVLNIGMSNNMKDMDRIELLRMFTNYNDIFGVP